MPQVFDVGGECASEIELGIEPDQFPGLRYIECAAGRDVVGDIAVLDFDIADRFADYRYRGRQRFRFSAGDIERFTLRCVVRGDPENTVRRVVDIGEVQRHAAIAIDPQRLRPAVHG